MGDTTNPSDKKATLLSFSTEDAARSLRITELPNIYEKALQTEKYSDAAMVTMRENLPADIANANLLQVGNTLLVIVYNPEEHRATVTFDPTHTFGDKLDNIQRGHKDHSMGGQVHGGYYKDIVKDLAEMPGIPGDNITDVISGVLHSYAHKKPDTPLSVDFAGFSSGGAQTVITAGEIIAQDFFKDNPNIKLDNVYTFGTPAYADQEFIDNFNNKIEALGAKAWNIQVHGDKTPFTLSPDDEDLFSRYDYGHVGTHVYISPAGDGKARDIMINPNKATLDALPEAENRHTFDAYKETLNTQTIVPEETPTIENAPVNPSAVVP